MRIGPDRRLEAAERLVEQSQAPGTSTLAMAQRFIDSALAHGVSLDHLWSWESARGRLGQTCLLAPHAGRTAMIFTSQPRSKAERAELGQVIAAACDEAGRAGVGLAQGLLTPGETGPLTAFQLAGFTRLGDLLYLRRAWTEPGEEAAKPVWPEGITVEMWREGDDATLAHALERSYEGTLDCPELCGMREMRDVLESHRATGRFDPALWWILRLHGEPAGALLLNPCPLQGTTELVYLGLAPQARGRGAAGSLLRMGLYALRSRAEKTVTCAVDTRNDPAKSLYERHGFVRFAQRMALVRPLSPGQSVENVEKL